MRVNDKVPYHAAKYCVKTDDTIREIWVFRIFRFSPKVTNLTAGSVLIYTGGAPNRLLVDTTVQVGQFCSGHFLARGYPLGAMAPQTFRILTNGPNLAPPGDCKYSDV